MAFTDLETLQGYVYPYYQTESDVEFLNNALAKFDGPECAASWIWGRKAGELGAKLADGITAIRNGSESTNYGKATDLTDFAFQMRDYYAGLCQVANGSGSGALLRQQNPDSTGNSVLPGSLSHRNNHTENTPSVPGCSQRRRY